MDSSCGAVGQAFSWRVCSDRAVSWHSAASIHERNGVEKRDAEFFTENGRITLKMPFLRSA